MGASLHVATKNGDIDKVEELLKAGANKDFVDEDGHTALHIAAHQAICDTDQDPDPHTQIIALLLQHQADRNIKDSKGQTSLSLAVQRDNQNLLHLLTCGSFSAKAHSVHSQRPLHFACECGSMPWVRVWIDVGEDVNVRNMDGATPLMIAATRGHIDVIKALINAGCNIDLIRSDGATALIIGVEQGAVSVVKALLEANADVHASLKDGTTALLLASQNVTPDPLWRFKQNGADTSFMTIAQMLLDKGANPATWNKDSKTTSLHHAAKMGKVDLLELFLDKGTGIDAMNHEEETPLLKASKAGQREAVELLLKRKANVNASAMDGSTALHHASEKGHKDIVKALLESGAEVNAKRQNGLTPLHVATKHHCTEVVKVLANANNKANIDQQTERGGMTPLYLASEQGDTEMVETLLRLGAKCDIATCEGETPMYAAFKNWHTDVQDALEQEGASVKSLQRGHIIRIFVRNLANFRADSVVQYLNTENFVPCLATFFNENNFEDDEFDANVESVLVLLHKVIHSCKYLTANDTEETNDLKTILTKDPGEPEISWIKKPNEDMESAFVVETYDLSEQSVYYGLYSADNNELKHAITFIYAPKYGKLFLFGEKLEILKPETRMFQENEPLDSICRVLREVKDDACSIEEGDKSKYLSLLPLCVCTKKLFQDSFPMLLSGVSQNALKQQPSPAMPQLQLADEKKLYKDTIRNVEFPVDYLPTGAKYYDFVARTLDLMNEGQFPNKCIVMDNPASYMAPPLADRFVSNSKEECRKGMLQVLFTTMSATVSGKCRKMVMKECN